MPYRYWTQNRNRGTMQVLLPKGAPVFDGLWICVCRLWFLFLVYIPVHLYLRSKQRLLASEELRNALHYLVDDSGIHTSQKDASADLPWEAVYKLIETKRNILIYSSRVNAYIIPKSQIEKEYRELIQIAAAHLPKYRLKTK